MLKNRELAQFKVRLEQRKVQLLASLKDTKAALAFLESSRPAELYEEAQEEAFSLGLKATGEHSWRELWEIERALAKIDSGTYGICEECGATITPKRLGAVPMARYCIDCQRAGEVPRFSQGQDSDPAQQS